MSYWRNADLERWMLPSAARRILGLERQDIQQRYREIIAKAESRWRPGGMSLEQYVEQALEWEFHRYSDRLDHYRNRPLHRSWDSLQADEEPASPYHDPSIHLQIEDLFRMMRQRLSAMEIKVLELYEMSGYTFAEIADMLDRSKTTIHRAYEDAIQKLRGTSLSENF